MVSLNNFNLKSLVFFENDGPPRTVVFPKF